MVFLTKDTQKFKKSRKLSHFRNVFKKEYDTLKKSNVQCGQ
ncbi:Hypothetical protein Eab7_1819 [Exiguobacterium antarcticum B7]|nr:Hypothetical protein Eab7_1819 [Exiguobacterium antarcticum B7]